MLYAGVKLFVSPTDAQSRFRLRDQIPTRGWLSNLILHRNVDARRTKRDLTRSWRLCSKQALTKCPGTVWSVFLPIYSELEDY